MMGSSWPRTFARPLIHGLAPGTRVMPVGTPSTSRVSSRATRYRSPAMRSATPTHSRPEAPSWLTCAETARPRRSSSASSSNGRSRRDLSVASSAMGGVSHVRAHYAAYSHGSRGQCRLGLRHELIGRYRLHHVINGPLAQPPDAIGLLALGGDHDDRDRARARIVRERPGGLVAVHAGHDDVHEDQIRAHLARQAHALGSVGRGGRAVAVLLE